MTRRKGNIKMIATVSKMENTMTAHDLATLDAGRITLLARMMEMALDEMDAAELAKGTLPPGYGWVGKTRAHLLDLRDVFILRAKGHSQDAEAVFDQLLVSSAADRTGI